MNTKVTGEHLTKHARDRVRQRGYKERDIELVLEHGQPTHDGVLLTGKDVAELVGTYKRRIADLQRLSGTAVFVEAGHVVSVYRPCQRRVRRMLRHGRGRIAA